MKTIIAGSRLSVTFNDIVKAVILSRFRITEVVSGTASGADLLGEDHAKVNNIPIVRFKPDWIKFGAAAGPIRNGEMAKYADQAIVVWNGIIQNPNKGRSGSLNMIEQMIKLNKAVCVYVTSTKDFFSTQDARKVRWKDLRAGDKYNNFITTDLKDAFDGFES